MNLTRYRKHARIAELKLAMMHSMFLREYGVEKTSNFFKSICDTFGLNWTIISSIINRKEKIYEINSTNRERFRQEVIFMGMLYGESKTEVGRRYLNLSKKSMYQHADHDYRPNVFITQEWLEGLDYTVVIAGAEAYKLEALRFIDVLIDLSKVVGNVSMAEVQI